MMKQGALFDDLDGGTTLRTVGVPGTRSALSKAQKLFNKLIARIEWQRQLLRQWRDYVPIHRQRVAVEFAPLQQRLRDRRIEMVALLDEAMNGKALGKTHREKVRDILLGQLTELLSEAPDTELERLYDKYSDVSFADARQDDMAFAQQMARSLFGVELDADEGTASPEDLAKRIAEKPRVDAQAQKAKTRNSGRKQSAKAAAREAMRKQAAESASRAIREAFRKLVSALHPDRESDPRERARKTDLMQQANQAYAARDLLALLELQLSLEQIDPATLTDMAEDRLGHYNLVLEEQVQRLGEEIADVTSPFVLGMGGPLPHPFTPEAVRQSLDDDMHALQLMLQGLEADLDSFRDIKALKSALRHYSIEEPDDDLDPLERLLIAELQGGLRTTRR